MRRKILVYGFGPYAEFSENITEAILALLGDNDEIVTECFETKFSRAMFYRALERHAPEIIIGLGQHRRARKLRIERKAVNLRGRKPGPLKPIRDGGPPYLFVNLRLHDSEETTVTCDAGTYVCNFSMYVCLEYCRKTGCRFAFIHVPRRYDAAAAAGYVLKAIRQARETMKASEPSFV